MNKESYIFKIAPPGLECHKVFVAVFLVASLFRECGFCLGGQ